MVGWCLWFIEMALLYTLHFHLLYWSVISFRSFRGSDAFWTGISFLSLAFDSLLVSLLAFLALLRFSLVSVVKNSCKYFSCFVSECIREWWLYHSSSYVFIWLNYINVCIPQCVVSIDACDCMFGCAGLFLRMLVL